MLRAYSTDDYMRYGLQLHCDECRRETNAVYVWARYEYQTCEACSPSAFAFWLEDPSVAQSVISQFNDERLEF